MEKERIEYLDTIKGICILLVVFCHFTVLPSHTYIGNIFMSMAWGAVPCFMMISGGLMHASPAFYWKKYIFKFLRLYSALIIWKIIYLLVHFFIMEISFSKTELIKYLFFFGDIPPVNTGVMWYINAYLTALLLYPVSYFLFHTDRQGKKLLFFLLTICFFSGIFIPFCNFLLELFSKTTGWSIIDISGLKSISPLTNYSSILFYFLLGAFLFEYENQLKHNISAYKYGKFIPAIMILLGTINLLFIKYMQTGSLQWNGIYLADGYNRLSTVLLALGIYFFFTIHKGKACDWIAKCIGPYTMGIYYIHYLLLIVCNTFLYQYLTGYYSFILNCIKTLFITFICILSTILIRKIPVVKMLVK